MESVVQPVSPEEVFLCVLVDLVVHPPKQDHESGAPLNQGRIARQLSVLILKEITRLDSTCYATLEELAVIIRNRLPDAGAEVVRTLAEKIRNLYSPNDVFVLFTNLGDLLLFTGAAPPAGTPEDGIAGIDPGSPIGLFIRRCRSSMMHMPYEALAQLYSSIHQQLGDARSGSSLRPTTAVRQFLDKKLQQVEKQGPASSSAQLEAQLAQLGPLAEELPEVQYVRVASALQSGDYTATLALLHRYNDYTHGSSRADAPSCAGGQPVSGVGDARCQSALLSLTSAQAAFGHVEPALQALNEALQVAQQNRDPWCLVHSLAALCRIMAASALSTTADTGPGSSSPSQQVVELARLLRRCQAAGADMGCPHLAAYARVALARFALLHSPRPTDSQQVPELDAANSAQHTPSTHSTSVEIQRALRQASSLAHASQLAAALPIEPPPVAPFGQDVPGAIPSTRSDNLYDTPAVFGRTSRATQQASALAARQLAGSAHALMAASWQMHGAAALAHTHCLLQLMCHQRSGRDEDLAVAWSQLVEVTAARKGVEAGEQVLQLAARQLPAAEHRMLAAARQRLAHQRAVNEGRLHAAQRAACGTLALCAQPDGSGSPQQKQQPGGSYSDLQLRHEARRQCWQALLAAGDYEAAMQEAGKMWVEASAAGMHVAAVSALLGMAAVHQQAGHPVGALPYVLSALLQAQTSGLDLLAAEATVLLAQLWPLLVPSAGSAAHSSALVQEVLPVLYAHGSLEQVADACAVLADLMLAHRSAEQLQQQQEECGWCRELLRTAAEGYSQVCAWGKAGEMYYLLACLCDATGLEEERDAAVRRYNEVMAKWDAVE